MRLKEMLLSFYFIFSIFSCKPIMRQNTGIKGMGENRWFWSDYHYLYKVDGKSMFRGCWYKVNTKEKDNAGLSQGERLHSYFTDKKALETYLKSWEFKYYAAEYYGHLKPQLDGIKIITDCSEWSAKVPVSAELKALRVNHFLKERLLLELEEEYKNTVVKLWTDLLEGKESPSQEYFSTPFIRGCYFGYKNSIAFNSGYKKENSNVGKKVDEYVTSVMAVAAADAGKFKAEVVNFLLDAVVDGATMKDTGGFPSDKRVEELFLEIIKNQDPNHSGQPRESDTCKQQESFKFE